MNNGHTHLNRTILLHRQEILEQEAKTFRSPKEVIKFGKAKGWETWLINFWLNEIFEGVKQ